jgi:hypothetical protein
MESELVEQNTTTNLIQRMTSIDPPPLAAVASYRWSFVIVQQGHMISIDPKLKSLGHPT